MGKLGLNDRHKFAKSHKIQYLQACVTYQNKFNKLLRLVT